MLILHVETAALVSGNCSMTRVPGGPVSRPCRRRQDTMLRVPAESSHVDVMRHAFIKFSLNQYPIRPQPPAWRLRHTQRRHQLAFPPLRRRIAVIPKPPRRPVRQPLRPDLSTGRGLAVAHMMGKASVRPFREMPVNWRGSACQHHAASGKLGVTAAFSSRSRARSRISSTRGRMIPTSIERGT